ncbi:hypothetical protein BCR42DRAFT_9580 [Absidia repens]|uniref:Serine aminopeptidase S33 domain-containing protein n=1 Tax=Absidia repens TaxID=90262 RepID=A0A1X2J136_9FUNG|nr:hypothetical protein BCR42DRAFT_9580 [Absidia repens]
MTANKKLNIVNNHGESIVGILETKSAIDAGRQQPRIILISHGVLGHKDYLFFRLLAEELPFSSFRFDFRGNGESDGKAGYAHMKEDADDIATVAAHFEKEGYEVYGIIGHSRGAVACLKYASSCKKPIPHVINCSGRYKMNDNQIYKNRPEIGASLDKHGYFDWSVKQRDRITNIKVTREDVDKFTSWDNSYGNEKYTTYHLCFDCAWYQRQYCSCLQCRHVRQCDSQPHAGLTSRSRSQL